MDEQIKENTAWIEADPETNTGSESPQSSSVVGYYKGFPVTITRRDIHAEVKPLIDKAMRTIDYMIEQGFMPSWNAETNKQFLGQANSNTPVTSPNALGQTKDCLHEHVTTKQSSGHNKPENKGRFYKACLDCKKFLEWEN